MVGTLFEDLAQRGDVPGECVLLDRGPPPDLFEQLLLFHDAAAPLDEQQQDFEGLRGDGNQGPVAPQQPLAGIDHVWAEAVAMPVAMVICGHFRRGDFVPGPPHAVARGGPCPAPLRRARLWRAYARESNGFQLSSQIFRRAAVTARAARLYLPHALPRSCVRCRSGLSFLLPDNPSNPYGDQPAVQRGRHVIPSRALPRGAGFGVANAYQAARSIQAQIRFSF